MASPCSIFSPTSTTHLTSSARRPRCRPTSRLSASHMFDNTNTCTSPRRLWLAWQHYKELQIHLPASSLLIFRHKLLLHDFPSARCLTMIPFYAVFAQLSLFAYAQPVRHSLVCNSEALAVARWLLRHRALQLTHSLRAARQSTVKPISHTRGRQRRRQPFRSKLWTDWDAHSYDQMMQSRCPTPSVVTDLAAEVELRPVWPAVLASILRERIHLRGL